MSDADPARAYAALRAETAQMLGFHSVDDLSPADGLRLDLTALLRLQLDSLQGRAFSGQQVDLSDLQSAFAMLQKLLPAPVLEVAPPREQYSARRKIAGLLSSIAAAHEAEAAAALEREEACMAEEALSHVVPSLPAATNVAADAAPPAPPPTSPQPPSPSYAAAVPKHYLRGEGKEPWRIFAGGGVDTSGPPPGSKLSRREW